MDSTGDFYEKIRELNVLDIFDLFFPKVRPIRHVVEWLYGAKFPKRGFRLNFSLADLLYPALSPF
jgi:hypothetical protein